MRPSLLLAVALGGFVGAPSRYLVDRAISARTQSDLPWGTAAVNISGSFLLGLASGLALAHHLSPLGMALLGTGFCGAYTTFSTFSFESVRLLEDGQVLEAAANVLASLALGLAGAAAGLALGLVV